MTHNSLLWQAALVDLQLICILQVAIKFEHKSSKGLTSKGVPYEWDIYQQLGDTPGLPMLLHKGFQDNFCVMVRSYLLKLSSLPRSEECDCWSASDIACC